MATAKRRTGWFLAVCVGFSLGIRLPALAEAAPARFATGSYSGRLSPEAGDLGSTPRTVSVRFRGGRFVGLHISGGQIGCSPYSAPASSFKVALAPLSHFPSFGVNHVGYPFGVNFTQQTPFQTTGPWITDGPSLGETGEVELIGPQHGHSLAVHLSIAYVADLQGRPTANPNGSTEQATTEAIARDSDCALRQHGSLHLVPSVAKLARAASATPKRTTVFQCQKRYPPGSQRAACIKRVKAKPGSSCAKPLISARAVDGAVSQGSDTKDFGVQLIYGSDREPGSGSVVSVRLDVEVHNPHAAICRAVIVTYPPELPTTTGPLPRTEHVLSIPPHGGNPLKFECRTTTPSGESSTGGIGSPDGLIIVLGTSAEQP
jgi:hypothetical protein